MKLTNKETHLLFNSMQDKSKAVDFLLKMGIKFRGLLNKPVLTVAPSNYCKHYLDLYLPEHIGGSTFNYKQSNPLDGGNNNLLNKLP